MIRRVRTAEGLAHYASMLDTKRQENNWIYQAHYAPHDIEARELNTGLSRKDYARQLGINFVTLPKVRVEDGIEAVRVSLAPLAVTSFKRQIKKALYGPCFLR